MRSVLLPVLLLMSCSSAPAPQKANPPTAESAPESQPASALAESKPAKILSDRWQTYLIDYGFHESRGGAGEVRLRSDGWLNVTENGKPLASLWLSAEEVAAVTRLLHETDWERAKQRKPDDEAPARSYTLKLSAPHGSYDIGGLVGGSPAETRALAEMIEALREKAVAAKPQTQQRFSIEILEEGEGGSIPVSVSTQVSSSGSVTRAGGLGIKGTSVDGLQLYPLQEALSALEAASLPARLPAGTPTSHIVNTTTIKISGDIKKTFIRWAEGVNSYPQLEPALARLSDEVFFLATRALRESSGSSLMMSFSCSLYGAAISSDEFSFDGSKRTLSTSQNKGAVTKKSLDPFMISALVGVLGSWQMKALLNEKPIEGPAAPGEQKCTLSFQLDAQDFAVTFSSKDEYRKPSKEIISSLWSTLNWIKQAE